ncbi:MAG: metalloregulator ArsR/SmtB family transcription factor [Chloroflexota bacterium]
MNTVKQADVFHAIAAPIRREIIHTLALTGDQTITDIATHYDISRQAVTRHIQVLQQSGVVAIQKRGREQICSFQADRLKEIYEWVTFYEQFWDTKLDALDNYLSKQKNYSETKGEISNET